MKPRLSWHRTPAGRVACFLGSIKPAIPVLLGVAGALAAGTFIESTHTAEVAKELVYGSWWFIALMTYICLALIFAVVVRYPWHRRHTGFMIVHAGIIVTIAGGFISLFGRVEGLMTLREGMSLAEIERPGRELQIIEVPATEPVQMARFSLSDQGARNVGKDLSADEMTIRIVDHWENSEQRNVIMNDSADLLEATQYTTHSAAVTGTWLGQSRGDDTRSKIFDGIQLRVLAANSPWEPAPLVEEEEQVEEATPTIDELTTAESLPATPGATRLAYLVLGDATDDRIEITELGQPVNESWRVKELNYFSQAIVSSEGLVEGGNTPNPAVQLILENVNDGTIERHIAFANYPELLIARPLQGETPSGLSLHFEQTGLFHLAGEHPTTPADPDRNRIVFQHNLGVFKATWVRADGTVKEFALEGEAPFALDLDGQSLYVLKHFTHARNGEEYVKSPKQKENRPVLVLEVSEGYSNDQRLHVPWNGQAPFTREESDRPIFFRYGAPRFKLPFWVQLKDFRKNDYPGSRMAMEYESDVVWAPRVDHEHVEGDDHSGMPEPVEQKIWMNNPLKYEGWKVYQSGFMGDDISTFSIMKDPGLSLTYLGCILLCSGILVIFYSKNYSHGHPGIAHYTKSGNVRERVKSGSTDGHVQAAETIVLPAAASDNVEKQRKQEGAAA